MDFAALDRAVLAGFATVALYEPRGNAALPLRGILDRHLAEVPGPGDGPPVLVPRATFSVRFSDLPHGLVPRQRDRLQAGDTAWEVREPPVPDAEGWLVLTLGALAA